MPKARGVYHAPSTSSSRRNRGRRCCVSSMTAMMRAYRESVGSLSARIVSSDSPFNAPESTGRLPDFERFARQIRLVHRPLALDHHSVHRANFMRKNDKSVTDTQFRERDFRDAVFRLSMRDVRHSLRQGIKNMRSTASGEFLERGSARQHQHDNRSHQVILQNDCGNDGNAREEIGTEFHSPQFSRKIDDEGNTAPHQRNVERYLLRPRRAVPGKSQQQMNDNSYRGHEGDHSRPKWCKVAWVCPSRGLFGIAYS